MKDNRKIILMSAAAMLSGMLATPALAGESSYGMGDSYSMQDENNYPSSRNGYQKSAYDMGNEAYMRGQEDDAMNNGQNNGNGDGNRHDHDGNQQSSGYGNGSGNNGGQGDQGGNSQGNQYGSGGDNNNGDGDNRHDHDHDHDGNQQANGYGNGSQGDQGGNSSGNGQGNDGQSGGNGMSGGSYHHVSYCHPMHHSMMPHHH